MRKVELKNHRKNKTITQIAVAEGFFSRAKGLMFEEQMLKDCQGIWITPCRSIHTFFMKFTIDAYFLDKSGKIVKIIKNMKPWRVSGIFITAHSVLEFKAGEQIDFEVNDLLEVVCSN